MASIADIFFRFLGDDAQLQIDAAKSGAKAGQTLGQGLSGGAKVGIGVAAAALTAVVGVALKGGLDLTNAMADFRAQTGATEAEAKQAQGVLVDLYKTNTDGFDTLSKVLVVVHNGLGLIGEDAKAMSQRILDFAHATETDAVQAATELDQVTKAYNLDAQQQQDLLDQLIVSQQKYGGSAEARLQNLIALAPALTAANLGTADGIGLLNLFAKAGVDADSASKALTHSLAKVKSPDDLKRLIADIANTKDPFERAAKASDLFGKKVGPALAAALAEGTGSLQDFTPAVTEAAGATEKAAAIVENKFTNRLTVLFHSLTGNLDALISNLSNVAQGAGALVGIAATLGIIKTGENGLTVAKLKNVAATVLETIATKAQGLAYLLLHPQYLLTAIQLGILTIAQTAYTVVTGLATLATVALGAAIAFLLSPIGLILIAVGLLFAAWQTNFLGIRDIVGAVVGFVADKLSFLLPILKIVGDALGAVFNVAGQVLGFIGGVIGSAASAVGDALNASAAAAAKTSDEMTKGIAAHLRSEHEDIANAAEVAVSGIPDAITGIKPQVADATSAVAHTISQKIADEKPVVEGNMGGLMTAAANIIGRRKIDWAYQAGGAAHSIGQALVDEGPIVLRNAADLMLKAASGIRDTRSAIDGALDQLKTDIKNRMNATAEIGHDAGITLGKTLSHGLHDQDPVVRAQAEATRDLIEARLIELVQAGGKAGKDINAEIARNMKSKDPDVRAQAVRTKSLLDEALKAKTAPKTPGDAIGDQLNANLQDKGTALGKTAYSIGRSIYANLLAGVNGYSAPGYVPPAGSHTSAGGVVAYAMGTSYVPYTGLAYLHESEAVLKPADAALYRAGGLGTSGPLIGSLNVDASGHKDPGAVGQAVKQAIGEAMADVLRDESIRGYMGTTP